MNDLSTPFHSAINNRSAEQKKRLMKALPELLDLERILSTTNQKPTIRTIDTIHYKDLELPIYAIDLGNKSPGLPSLLISAGVHGIERIGSQVVIALLNVWLHRLDWEKTLGYCLNEMSITVIPIVNPLGMYLNRRANGNGVDLMRNSPIDAEISPPFLVGGQRISRRFPWYRGNSGTLEAENIAVEKEVKRMTENSPVTVSIDCHSGFGLSDRIWFPYAYRRRPLNRIAPIVALKLLWENSYPNHQYIFEPQSNQYTTHGDLWDYLYKKYGREHNAFLPLTLEMGSWNWVKKHPSQLLKFEGLFNPMVPHRQQRTLRRHLPFMDFLRHAVLSFKNWLPNESQIDHLEQMATSLWYRDS